MHDTIFFFALSNLVKLNKKCKYKDLSLTSHGQKSGFMFAWFQL